MQPRKTRISVGWRSGWWILWVVIGLARASANGCGDNTTFHEKPYNFEHRYLAPDSVFKIVRDSAVDGKSDTRVKSIDLKPHTAARLVIVAPDTYTDTLLSINIPPIRFDGTQIAIITGKRLS